MHDLCNELASGNLEDKKIISVAAGIKLDQIEKLIPRNKVYRVMPNIGSKNNLGITAVFSKNDNQELLELLKILGEAYEVDNEDQIDLHTVLLGSTPAFFYDLLHEFESRVEELIDDKDQIRVATIVFLSSLITSISKGQDLLELVESVASKGGTTEAGINFLREQRFNEIFSKAVDAGIIRARELSKD
jgi:pyrroline-5-carboxylate reductase